MKAITIMLMFLILISGKTSTNNKDIALISTKTNSVKGDANSSNLIKFKNYNKIKSFITQNDTLFCETENGLLFYDRADDKWLIDKIYKFRNLKFSPKLAISLEDGAGKIINGYHYNSYTTITRQNDNCSLIVLFDEGSFPYQQEIVDTIQRVIYRLPYEMIKDFKVEDSIIWVGSEFGISKINIETLSRTEYCMLPAFKQVKSIIETSNSLFYLDFHYGLFKYNKKTKCITPISGINRYVNESGFKFSNSCLIDKNIYTIAFPMWKQGEYLRGNACLLIYNTVTHEVKRIDTNTKYLDTFLPIDDYLICYGSWIEGYEGGEVEYFGGAIAYNLKNGLLSELSTTPINKLKRIKDGVEATAIQQHDPYIFIEKSLIFIDSCFHIKNVITEVDTFYRQLEYDYKDGDTVNYFDRKVVIDQKHYDEYSNLEYSFIKQQRISLDSLLSDLLVNPTMIKIENKKIEKDKY
jgi:hypothetical protein